MNGHKLDNPHAAWQSLYRLAGAAALIAVLVFRRNCGAELVQFNGFGIWNVPQEWPRSAIDWFSLLQRDRWIGLALMDGVDLVNYALLGLILLALCVVLWRTNKSASLLATACGLTGIGVHFASNQALAMLTLSQQYAAATSDAQRSILIAAGEALLAIHNPGTIYQGLGIYSSLFLVLLAGLIFAVAMLRSDVFGRATAVVGILANGIGLSFFLVLAIAPAILWLPASLYAPFRLAWYVLIARRLFQLARQPSRDN